ncbi:hypothetical protein OEZ86_013511 [Tetradesmus obliquus]|nr:hypothetical protein OEZ86_013511 [Tetradesmus obliquus]
MHLTHVQTILQPGDGIHKVSSLAWAPNNSKLAAATADKVVHLFDENGDKRDKFKTKAADPNGPGAYLVVFYYANGREQQAFDYSSDPEARDFSSCCFNPSGDTAVVGAFSRFYVYSLNSSRGTWEQVAVKQVDNFYTTTSVSWKPDGSKLAVGGLTGTVDVYDACLRRYKYKGKFEFTYVSKTAVIVKTLATGSRTVLKSVYGYEIEKINVYQDRFNVGRTQATLLLGDLESCRLSEIPWESDLSEKFYFEHEKMCLLFRAGELSVIEYGTNEELNLRGSHLLFRDKRHQLHVYDLAAQTRSSLLDFCQYVQWVPGSDVVVAQSRSNLCVWYSVKNPDRVTMIAIKGDVEGIQRSPGRTEVLVDEGIASSSYTLDEALIDFGSALDDLGQVDEAIAAYQQAHRWDDAIRVADTSRHPQTEELRRAHYQWLLQTSQEDKAASVKEREGDYLAAISLYLKGGLPARAAQVIISHGGSYDPALLDSIAASLTKAGLQERCGDLYQHLNRQQEALQAYRKGHAYRKAVELARVVSPASVITLEEEWGDWLASQKQMDAAINHFIEAGSTLKAIEAAIAARQFTKAAGIVDFLEPGKAQPYYRRIGQHYEESNNRQAARQPGSGALVEQNSRDSCAVCKRWEEAERYLLRAGAPLDAVEMWMRADNWEAAQKVARGYLSEDELHSFYSKRARACEANGQWLDAERAYVAGGEIDMAVAMYKRSKSWLAMLKLVQKHRREQLPQAHLMVAQALQAEGSWREAERHFCEAKEWKAAVAMYRQQGSWEDALRVAKVFGGLAAAKQVAYAWAISLSQEEAASLLRRLNLANAVVAYAWAISLSQEDAASLLRRLNLADAVVDYAVEAGAFPHAFQLAQVVAKAKLPDVHLKYAMFLEDSGRFQEAEGEFLNAGKPREAIDMYLHNQDWDAAMRVAEQSDPTAVMDILAAQASAAAAAQQFPLAESLYLKAKRPEGALAMYRQAGQWQQALRLAEAYLPGKIQASPAAGRSPLTSSTMHESCRILKCSEIHLEMASSMPAVAGGGLEAAVARAQAYERGNDFARAIEAYLSLSPADTNNMDALQQCWEQQLVGIGRVAAAAELQEGINDIQGAIDTLCTGGMFDRARLLAGSNPQLLQHIEQQHTQHLVENNDAEQLAARGNAAAAVDMYAAQGNWKRAHELAAHAGPDVAASCAARHATLLFRQRDWPAAVAVLAEHGVSSSPGNFELYREVVLEVLAANMQQRQQAAEEHAREMLYRLQQQLDSAGPQVRKQDAEDFRRLMWASHYIALAHQARAGGLLELAAKQLTAALRYVGIVPADRAFFEAGMAWKAAGHPNMAFVMLNLSAAAASAAAPAAAAARSFFEAGMAWKAAGRPNKAFVVLKTSAAAAAAAAARAFFEAGMAWKAAGRPNKAFVVLKTSAAAAAAAAAVRVFFEAGMAWKAAGRRNKAFVMLKTSAAAAAAAAARAFFEGGMAWKAAGRRNKAFVMLKTSAAAAAAARAFFEAGMAWKAAGRRNKAFVMLNRFLDLADALEDPEGDMSALENADFADTDVPFDVALPEAPYATEAAREEARNYVLEVSMDQAVEQSLSTRPCEHCGVDTYEAALTCHACGAHWEPCAVSGYPVPPGEKVVPRGNTAARKDDWNAWVNKFHTDPVTGAPATPLY